MMGDDRLPLSAQLRFVVCLPSVSLPTLEVVKLQMANYYNKEFCVGRFRCQLLCVGALLCSCSGWLLACVVIREYAFNVGANLAGNHPLCIGRHTH